MNYSLLNASSLDDDVNITSINSNSYQNNKHNRERNNENNNNSSNHNDNFIQHKKRNKTQRNNFQKNTTTEGFYTPKVNTLLNAIHNSSNNEDSDDENNYHSPHSLQNYIPLQPPESVGVQNTILKEDETKKIKTSSDYSNSKYNSNSPSIIDNPDEYYNKMLPNGIPDLSNYSLYNNTTDVSLIPPTSTHNPVANSYYNNNNTHQYNGVSIEGGGGNDVLVTKLNYLIHLLEEQKSEKTGNILEEVILYSFLGIFIIFVIDSFTRLGKYTR
jgi:hypothetical protein